MRHTLVKFAAICSLLPALAIAEPEFMPGPPPGEDLPMDAGPGHHRGDGPRHRFSPRDRLMKLMDKLEVTDAQKQKIEELLKANEENIRNSFKAEFETRRELHRLGFSADFSGDKVKALLAKMQPAREQAILQKARLDNAIFKLLTAEQQQKLQQLLPGMEPPPEEKPQ